MNRIKNLFKDKAIIRGGIMLFSKEDALLFVKACENNEIQILGMDAFYMTENYMQPSLDNSIDFSSSGYIPKEKNIYLEAVNFLKEKNEELFFEIVYMD